MTFTSSRTARVGSTGCTVPTHPDYQTVALCGEMDISTAPACREQLDHGLDAAAAGHRQLIIDLSGVSFCDATGLSTLVATRNRARGLATTVCLAAPRPQMVRLLHITGLDRGLTTHRTLTGAITALSSCHGL